MFSDVVALFSEDVRGVDEDTFTLSRSSTGAEVPAFVFSRGDSDRWTLRPEFRLREDTRYTVELEGGSFGIRDRAGNTLFDEQWSFVTAGDDDRRRRSDFRRPRLVDEFPRDGAARASTFTDVRARFSESVRGVNTRTFRLFSARTGRRVFADVFRTGASKRWVLAPERRLARGTRYVVALRGGFAGIRDIAGNRLSSTTWSFRTRR